MVYKHRLWLNLDETELMCCSSAQLAGSFMQPSICNDGSVIWTTDSVRDLRVILRTDMSMNDQIIAVIHSRYYNIKLLSIRASRTRDMFRDAAYTLVKSCINYCNLCIWTFQK